MPSERRSPVYSGLISLAVTITMCTVWSVCAIIGPILLPVSYIAAGSVCAVLVVYYLNQNLDRGTIKIYSQSLVCLVGLGLSVWLLNGIDYQPEAKLMQLTARGQGRCRSRDHMAIAWLLKMR